jgi:hypothetical protein
VAKTTKNKEKETDVKEGTPKVEGNVRQGWVGAIQIGEENLRTLETVAKIKHGDKRGAVTKYVRELVLDHLENVDIKTIAKASLNADLQKYRDMGLSKEDISKALS